jgi:putative ATP-dependent endonuclease of OLD family
MLIQRLEIKNYRALHSVDVNCDLSGIDSRALVAILGRNGAGKSSILYALDVFYDTAAKLTKADCYGHDPQQEIFIRVTYGALRADERAEFQPYLENGTLIVTKRITVTDSGCVQKYYAAARQIPQFAELRKLSRSERLKQFKTLVSEGLLQGLEGSPRSADQADELMATYEQLHPELLQTVEREEQFFGPKDIGGGKLDKFTKFVLVPAVRSAAAEDQRKGVIADLINTIVLRQVNRRPDVRQLRNEMKEKIARIFSPGNLTELGDLGSAISTLLEQYAPGSSLRLRWNDPITPDIPLPQAHADLVEDDFACPIAYAGHGLQRGLVLTLLQYLARVERPTEEEAEATIPVPTEEALPALPVAEVVSPDLILAIEEPELYLHPARCRHLSELLLTLSKAPANAQSPRNQVIYATHSPYFVDLHRFDQVRIARKPRVEGHTAPRCVMSQYSLDEAARALAGITQKRAEDFTRDSFRARLLPVMTTAVNEGFFANTVVVVEGLSDVGVLWRLQSILEQQWSALSVAVVPALGKENLDRPVVVFRGLQIPTYFIFDADRRHQGRSDELATAKRNSRYLRLAGATVESFPDTQVHDLWAVYSHDIETLIKEAVGQPFDAIAQKAVDELRYDGVAELMKNTEGAARLIELVYRSGHTVPILEEIIRKVTALATPSAATPEEPAVEAQESVLDEAVGS